MIKNFLIQKSFWNFIKIHGENNLHNILWDQIKLVHVQLIDLEASSIIFFFLERNLSYFLLCLKLLFLSNFDDYLLSHFILGHIDEEQFWKEFLGES